MSNTTAPPTPGGITARALHAADRPRRDTAHPPTWRDARWAERAEACARELAALLGITASQVQVSPDYTRAYGDWPWPHLTVTEPDGTIHHFLGAHNNPERQLDRGWSGVLGALVRRALLAVTVVVAPFDHSGVGAVPTLGNQVPVMGDGAQCVCQAIFCLVRGERPRSR